MGLLREVIVRRTAVGGSAPSPAAISPNRRYARSAMGFLQRWLGNWFGARTRGAKASVAEARPFRRGAGLAAGSPGAPRDLRTKFCGKPWEHFEIHPNGNTYLCCPKWLPTVVGNSQEQDLDGVWNSAKAKAVRASVLDGSFKHCVQAECPAIQAGSLPERDAVTDPFLRRVIDQNLVEVAEPPRLFNLCYDESCNLQCPSCRRDRIFFGEGPDYERRKRIQDMLVAGLFAEPHERHFRLNITGSGDPFGSKLFRDLLTSVDGSKFPNVVFDLQTNGVLFTQANWDRMHKLHGNIGNVLVSFDAATADTYAYTRKGGNWTALLENARMLGELRRALRIRQLRFDFVVQQRNYREMPEFVRLAKELAPVDAVSFNLITDWGTYGREFAEHAIWRSDHPEFAAFLAVLRAPELQDPLVHLGNVSGYRQQALAANGA